MYTLLLYNDSNDFMIFETNIKEEFLQHFVFLFCNCRELKIDFFATVKNARYEITEIQNYVGTTKHKYNVSDYFLDK